MSANPRLLLENTGARLFLPQCVSERILYKRRWKAGHRYVSQRTHARLQKVNAAPLEMQRECVAQMFSTVPT